MSNQLILERIKQVEKLGIAYKDANYLKDKNVEIENYQLKFSMLTSKVDTLYNSYTNLKNICDLTEINIKYIYSEIKTVKESLEKDNYDIQKIDDIKKLLDGTNKLLMSKWKKFIEDETTSIDSVLNTLGTIVSEREEIALLMQEKEKFSNTQPGKDSAREALAAYKRIYKTLLKELNFDENILNFLSKLSLKKKLTLEDVDIDVYQWLKNNGFANKVFISVR